MTLGEPLEPILYDLRFALRALKRDRTFAATSILLLALAAGLNLTAFRVMDGMVFRSYPLVKENHRLDLEQWSKQARSTCCWTTPDREVSEGRAGRAVHQRRVQAQEAAGTAPAEAAS